MRYFAESGGREAKARKIEAVLCDYLSEKKIATKKILDLGCGSGHIAEYFSRANEVIAADVVNQLTVERKNAFTFTLLDKSVLTFEDDYFDIVILNHVFYCFADHAGQLKEIYRVLKKNGVCYFASANRYFPVEGFTKLPLIHYLPGFLFRILYKKIRKTDDDLFPTGYHRMINLAGKAGFTIREYTAEIIHNPAKYYSEYDMPFNLPVPVCISPTIVLILRK
jgi:ubiquinone/menaquinone biosynthesis C-methylase UbiE